MAPHLRRDCFQVARTVRLTASRCALYRYAVHLPPGSQPTPALPASPIPSHRYAPAARARLCHQRADVGPHTLLSQPPQQSELVWSLFSFHIFTSSTPRFPKDSTQSSTCRLRGVAPTPIARFVAGGVGGDTAWRYHRKTTWKCCYFSRHLSRRSVDRQSRPWASTDLVPPVNNLSCATLSPLLPYSSSARAP
jgi:hypothetical protein